jgi:hypothetical protein
VKTGLYKRVFDIVKNENGIRTDPECRRIGCTLATHPFMPQRSSAARDVLEWTRSYETWLAGQVPHLVEADVCRKHVEMADSPFVFLRATYYAWARQWPATLPDLCQAPAVTCVGDLHFENFGTWRDAEGRLAWGVNDFDEASVLPYTNDLVRLAASVALAHEDQRIRTPAEDLAKAFLASYRGGLKSGGRAIVFGEEHRRLEEHILLDLVRSRQEKSDKKKRKGKKKKKAIEACYANQTAPAAPADCRQALEAALPAGPEPVSVRARVAGVGSLGRPRFLARRQWNGGEVFREAKARVPSATAWASEAASSGPAAFDLLLSKSVRSRDPFLHLAGRWVVRRIAADTDKIEIDVGGLPRSLELELAALMGREVANVHRATEGAAAAILEDLRQRRAGWLIAAAREMAAVTERSHQSWKKALFP